MNSDWFKELFIDEAKNALNRHNGSGGSGGSGSVISWNDLTDKPFGEEKATKVLFDGTGLLAEDGVGACYGSISPVGEIVPIEECATLHIEGVISDDIDNSQETISADATIAGSYARFQTESCGQITIEVTNGKYRISTSVGWGFFNFTLKVVGEMTEVKTLDPKYLPLYEGEAVIE